MTEGCYRRTAIAVGALFIIATASAVASGTILGNSLDTPDLLLNLSQRGREVVFAVVFELMLAASMIGIGSLMFPVLRRQAEGLALGYAGIRLMEAAFVVIASISLLVMLTMGEYQAAGGEGGGLQSFGALLVALREWSYLIGTLVFLGIGAAILNYILYCSQLIPRWLSVWGFIGALFVLLYGILGLFGTDTNTFDATTLLAAPLAVQEMALAVWLIFKGFAEPARSLDHLSSEAQLQQPFIAPGHK